jgi:NADPH:quinone reductase-like Zn-dependent oxidoreductase
MKAAVLRSADGVPEYAEFAEPEPGQGQEVVELVAAGLHQVVRSIAHNRHYGSTGVYPLVPGVDAVARTPDGRLVYTGYVTAPYGTMAERMAVTPKFEFEIPAGLEDRAERVAGGVNPGLSSWLPLQSRLAEVERLGTVVVVGGTGASGLLAVQNAKHLGAERVLALGRNEAGLVRAAGYGATPVRLGADKAATAAAVLEALEGHEPSIVLDYLWGAPAEAMFAALGRRGLTEDTADIAYVQIGALAGAEAALPAALLRSRRIRVVGSGAGSAGAELIRAQLPGFLELLATGRVVTGFASYPLSEVARAWTVQPEPGTRIVLTA